MSEFQPGDLGYCIAIMVGGPLDGVGYKDIPIMPDGVPGERLTVPLGDVTPTTPFASYVRRPTAGDDGAWRFDFEDAGVHLNTTSTNQPPADEAGETLPERAVDTSPQPAMRFIESQAWWIAAELCRRHPQLRVREEFPLGGMARALFVHPDDGGPYALLNLTGSLIAMRSGDDEADRRSWAQAFQAEGAHDIVKWLEESLRLPAVGASPTTGRLLTYRVLAAILQTKVNDPWAWKAGGGYKSEPGWDETPRYADYFREFGSLSSEAKNARPDELLRYWTLWRDEQPCVVLNERGVLFSRSMGEINLLSIYQMQHRLSDVLDVVRQAMG